MLAGVTFSKEPVMSEQEIVLLFYELIFGDDVFVCEALHWK